MPLKQCNIDGKDGWKWGDSGHCYPGEEGKKEAIKQGLAEGEGKLYEESAVSYFRDVSEDARQKLADKGHAMPDGSFPIANRSDLENAIKAYGRAKDPEAVKRFIRKRAKDLGMEDALPQDWKNYAELKGVEIFASGEHNGDKFTNDDLDEMAAAHAKLDFVPPLKQGHSKDNPGQPALGYVTNVRREGNKLVADFTDMPDPVYDAIKRKSYNRVSSEVYMNLKRNGEVFKKALKAVALLGAEIPAVAGLAPLSALFKEIDSEVRVYTFDAEDEESPMTPEEKKLFEDMQTKVRDYEAKLTAATVENEASTKALRSALDSATATINLLVKKDRESGIETKVKHCALPAVRPFLGPLYELAMEAPETREFSVGKDKDGKDSKAKAIAVVDQLVEQINKTVTRLFGENMSGSYDRAEDVTNANAGQEINTLVAKYQKENKDVSYAEALRIVMKDNPELAKAYNSSVPATTVTFN